ncbi:MAG: 8-oxo-dGTP diphosphatase [Truepera sp.]|nr:8-oxo-dGTP diphosphatase [Truepera sp.]
MVEVALPRSRFAPDSLLMGVILTSLCYLRRGGCTLMVHKARGQQRGKWNGLGGKFEPGERPEVCARREVIEESGLTVGRLEYRGLLTFPRFDGVHDIYSFVFTSTDFRGELRASGEGELAWVPDDELLDLELHEGDRVFLPWLDPKSPTLQGRVFSACLRYREGIFTGYEVSFYPPD